MKKESIGSNIATIENREKDCLLRLYAWEDLAEKKSRVYSKLLTEVSLAKAMEEIANRHEERKNTLASLIEEV